MAAKEEGIGLGRIHPENQAEARIGKSKKIKSVRISAGTSKRKIGVTRATVAITGVTLRPATGEKTTNQEDLLNVHLLSLKILPFYFSKAQVH